MVLSIQLAQYKYSQFVCNYGCKDAKSPKRKKVRAGILAPLWTHLHGARFLPGLSSGPNLPQAVAPFVAYLPALGSSRVGLHHGPPSPLPLVSAGLFRIFSLLSPSYCEEFYLFPQISYYRGTTNIIDGASFGQQCVHLGVSWSCVYMCDMGGACGAFSQKTAPSDRPTKSEKQDRSRKWQADGSVEGSVLYHNSLIKISS